jgi:hypothetical protein
MTEEPTTTVTKTTPLAWATRLLAAVLVGLLGVGAWFAYLTFMRARDAADSSCLASIHVAIQRGQLLHPARDTASWREWPQPEVHELLARLPGPGDCQSTPDAEWRGLLRIRSREMGAGIEVQLWLRGRPQVSSPWGVQGLE